MVNSAFRPEFRLRRGVRAACGNRDRANYRKQPRRAAATTGDPDTGGDESAGQTNDHTGDLSGPR